MQTALPNLQKVTVHHSPSNKFCTNIGLLKPGLDNWRNCSEASILAFHAGFAGETLLRTYILPSCTIGGVYRDLLQKVIPVTLQDADLHTRIHLKSMHVATRILSSYCDSGILEQHVWGTNDRTRCTNGMTCSFCLFNSLRFLYLGTSKFYCSCSRRRQWGPALTTWMWTDSYIWTFSANQAMTVQTCSVIRWISRCTIWTFSLIFKRA